MEETNIGYSLQWAVKGITGVFYAISNEDPLEVFEPQLVNTKVWLN